MVPIDLHSVPVQLTLCSTVMPSKVTRASGFTSQVGIRAYSGSDPILCTQSCVLKTL